MPHYKPENGPIPVKRGQLWLVGGEPIRPIFSGMRQISQASLEIDEDGRTKDAIYFKLSFVRFFDVEGANDDTHKKLLFEDSKSRVREFAAGRPIHHGSRARSRRENPR